MRWPPSRSPGGGPGAQLPVICAQNASRTSGSRSAASPGSTASASCCRLRISSPGRVESQGPPHPGMLDVGRYPIGVDALAEEVAIDLSAAGFLSIARAEVIAGSTPSSSAIWAIPSRRCAAMTPTRSFTAGAGQADDGTRVARCSPQPGSTSSVMRNGSPIARTRFRSRPSKGASAAAVRRGRAPPTRHGVDRVRVHLNGEITLLVGCTAWRPP